MECIKDLERERTKEVENKAYIYTNRHGKREDKEKTGGEQHRVETFSTLKKLRIAAEEDRKRKIKESRYNDYYKEKRQRKHQNIFKGRKGIGVKQDIDIDAKTRGNHHWRDIEDKRCRICEKEENLIYVLRKYRWTRDNIQVKEFLKEEEKELKMMRMK